MNHLPPITIDPATLGMKGHRPSYTDDEVSSVELPPCPACGHTVHVDWINAQTRADHGPRWILGRWGCRTNGCRYWTNP